MTDGGVVETANQAAQSVATQTGAGPNTSGQISWLLIPLAALLILFVVTFVRALPLWSEKTRTSRPLVCDVCMVAWTSIALGLYLGSTLSPLWAVIHLGPAAGLAVLLLALKAYWSGQSLGGPPA